MDKKYNIAVLGATGLVGGTIIQILEERNFPVGNLYPLASSRSAGKKVVYKSRKLDVIDAAYFDFSKAQIGLFSAGASVSKTYAPKAAAAGCVVIDNTSQFRYDDDVPLVVPEINPHAIAQYRKRGIIANPNCSTIQMLMALKPIHDRFKIERITISTYQSVSGSGAKGIAELEKQTKALYDHVELVSEVYAKPIAGNVVPQIDEFQENGYTKEEMKMSWETKKILEDDSIRVNATAVRVPVVRGHSESINIETRDKVSAAEATELMRKMAGVVVKDERRPGGYATPATDAAGRDEVYVSRVREDISCERGLNMWVTSDNIRKGAALNAVQIAEYLIKMPEFGGHKIY